MRNFLSEFKNFAMKGNVIDLAVAVVIGTAFGKITTALVNNVIMPAFGIVLGGIDFSDKSFKIGEASIAYGAFIQAVIEFIIIAFALFIIIKALKKLQNTEEKKEEEKKPATPTEDIILLREIRDSLKKK